MLLPLTTVIIAAVLTALFAVLLLTATIVYCKRRKDSTSANNPEELDRFLSEESEDEKFVGSATHGKSSKSYDEETFHFVDVQVEENENQEKTSDLIETGDEVILDVIGNELAVECALGDALVLSENIPVTSEDECVIVGHEGPTPDDDGNVAEQLSISVESLEVEPATTEAETTAPVEESTGGTCSVYSDDASVLSDPEQSIASGADETKKTRTKRRSRSLLSSTFAINAKLKLSLQYIESVKCLKGNIKAVEGLDFQADYCPTEINFHMRLFPSKRFHMATKYKSVLDDTSLNLSFTMGPITQEDLANNKLRIRLYGKKANLLTMSKCYGESSYELNEVVGKTERIDFEENVLERPRGSVVYSSSDSDVGVN